MDYRSQMQRDLDRSATVNVPRISLNSALARSVHDSVGESPVTTILAPISPVQSVFTIEQSPQSTPSERRILRRMPAGLSVNRSGSTRSFLTAASIETNTGSVRGFEFRTEPPRPFRVSYTDNLHTGFTGVTEDTASVYGAMSEERGLQKESGFLKEPDRKDESDRREDVYYDAQDGLESPCPQVRPARNTASEQIHMGATPFVVMTKAPAVAEMKSRHHAAFPLLSKPHPNTTITMNPSPNTEIEIVLERSSQLVNDIARETNKLSQQAKRFCTPSPTLESPVALDTQQRVQQPWVTEEPRKQDKNFRPATPVDLAETGRVVIPSPLKHTNKNNPNPSPTTPCKRPAAVARWVHLNTHEIIEMDGKHIPISRPDLPHDPHGDGTFTPDYEVEENPMMIRDPSGVKHDVARTPNRLDLMATKATNRTVAAPKHVPASEPVSGPAEDVIRHIYPHKINSPGTYWNQQRQRKSLPLRDYENMATGKGKGKSAIPQGVAQVSGDEIESGVPSTSRKVSDSTQKSDENTFTNIGLTEALMAIWPNELPRNWDELMRGIQQALDSAILEYRSPSSTTHTVAPDLDEPHPSRRHHRMETVQTIYTDGEEGRAGQEDVNRSNITTDAEEATAGAQPRPAAGPAPMPFVQGIPPPPTGYMAYGRGVVNAQGYFFTARPGPTAYPVMIPPPPHVPIPQARPKDKISPNKANHYLQHLSNHMSELEEENESIRAQCESLREQINQYYQQALVLQNERYYHDMLINELLHDQHNHKREVDELLHDRRNHQHELRTVRAQMIDQASNNELAKQDAKDKEHASKTHVGESSHQASHGPTGPANGPDEHLVAPHAPRPAHIQPVPLHFFHGAPGLAAPQAQYYINTTDRPSPFNLGTTSVAAGPSAESSNAPPPGTMATQQVAQGAPNPHTKRKKHAKHATNTGGGDGVPSPSQLNGSKEVRQQEYVLVGQRGYDANEPVEHRLRTGRDSRYGMRVNAVREHAAEHGARMHQRMGTAVVPPVEAHEPTPATAEHNVVDMVRLRTEADMYKERCAAYEKMFHKA